MKNNRLFMVMALALLLCASCKKSHYSLNEVKNVNVEGNVKLPLASGSVTIMDLMESFKIDSLIDFNASGQMSYNYYYEHPRAVSGENLLKFKDMEINEHLAFDNPFPGLQINPFDTVICLNQPITFQADHIHVLSAKMRSGHFEFDVASNLGQISKIVITSSEIKDASGQNLRFVYLPMQGINSFDFGGMHYETAEPNALTLNYEVYLHVQNFWVNEFTFDFQVKAADLAIQEMSGRVDAHDIRSSIDTTFSLFPNTVVGSMEVEDILVSISERNTFNLEAALAVDTALVWGEDVSPYSLFPTLPLVLDAPSSMDYTEVHTVPVDARLNTSLGNVYTSTLFTINPDGMDGIVSVADTCGIDLKVRACIPFSFRADNVRYIDTVVMKMDDFDSPDWIKKLTLELTFSSTIPFGLTGKFMTYNSVDGVITDVLLDDSALIGASYDERPVTTSIVLEITEEHLRNFLNSDNLIMSFGVDTDGHEIMLNANQGLQFSLKADVEYDN